MPTNRAAKLPPQNIEAEQSLLGSLLIDKDAIVQVAEMIHAAHFYRTEQHGKIYEAIIQLFEKREPIDLVTVTEQLRHNNALDVAGGPAYLTTLVNMVPTAAHVETYAQMVKEHYIRRQLIAESTRMVENAYDEGETLEDLIDHAEQSIFSLSQQSVKRDFVPLRDILTVSFDRLDELQKTSGKLRGVPTGFKDLDNKLAGLQDSNLIIFAARPGAGKCLSFDSKLVHPETGELVTIQDYYKQQTKPILTLNEHLKLIKTEVSNFVDDGFKDVYKVRTATGREIETTITHPFLTIGGWKKLSEMKVGEKVALPRAIPVFGKGEMPDHQIKLLAYFLSDGGLTGINPRFTNTNPRIVADFMDAIETFDNARAVLSDSGGKRAPSYSVKRKIYSDSNISHNFALELAQVLEKNGLNQQAFAQQVGVTSDAVRFWLNGESLPSYQRLTLMEPFFSSTGTLEEIRKVSKNSVTSWLEELSLMGKNAFEKAIPSVVFTLPRSQIALFLSRLFACDGSVYLSQKKNIISYCSVSKELIYGVQHLLLRFGILSKIRIKHIKYRDTRRPAYELEICSSEDVLRFCDEISIYGKEEKVNKAKELSEKRMQQNNFTKDTLPIEVWDVINGYRKGVSWREIYRRLGIPLSHNFHVGKRHPKRATVLKIAEALNCEVLKDLATSDIFWDKVTSIEPMGPKQVYDLTIGETHNFVANDFYVHNTAFVLGVALHAALKANVPVGFFSLEMSQEELVDRLLVNQADIDAWKLKTGRLDEKDFDRLSHAMGELAEAPLYIDDTPGMSLAEIRTKARRLQMEHGLKLIVIDYLQLIHGRNQENRVQEVSEISQGLKNLARELKIPVFALSQLSRAVEARGTRKPQLSDLRDSGAIEQDADVVMFIYREDPENFEDVTLDIQKHRNGAMGEIKLIFRGDRMRFYGMEKSRIAAPKKEIVAAA